MKVLRLVKHGKAEESFKIEQESKPTISENEVLIDVHCTGLNFADVVARRGKYPDAPPLPSVIGYDVAGKILEKGTEVNHVEIGDRVTALTRFGGYASIAKTSGFGVCKIPEQISYPKATALSTQACTAYYCAIESVNLYKGQKVLIQAAAGGVGHILVQIAKSKGCIVYGTSSSSKIDLLKKIGVDYPIDYTKEDFVQVISDKGDLLDVVFDSIGGGTYRSAFKLLNKCGKMVNIGAAEQMTKTNRMFGIFGALNTVRKFGFYNPIQLLMGSKSLIGVNMLRVADYTPEVFAMVLKNVVNLYQQGVIQPMIGKEFQYQEIAEAHKFLEERKSIGKVVVNWK